MSKPPLPNAYFTPVPGGPQGAGPTKLMVPEGDTRERLVCAECGYVRYENPRIIVGAVCTWNDRFLMCRRAIPPRVGTWCLPAGFMELGESTEEGARREVWEEAGANVDLIDLLAIYNLSHISQVHMIYRARMRSPEIQVGSECQDVALMTWDEIPWDSLAYPTVRWALSQHRDVEGQTNFAPKGIPVDDGSPRTLPTETVGSP